MAFDILDEFVHFIILPHSVVYILYYFVKYVLFLIYYHDIFILYWKFVVDLFGLRNTGCYMYFCRRNCSNSANNPMKFDRWLIKLLLGREEGVVERHHDDYRPDEDS